MKNSKFFNVSVIASPSTPSIKLYAFTNVTKNIVVMIWAKIHGISKTPKNPCKEVRKPLIN